jgi:hypothetical protein
MNSFLTPLTQMFNNAWYKGIILQLFVIIGITIIINNETKLKTTAILLPGKLF